MAAPARTRFTAALVIGSAVFLALALVLQPQARPVPLAVAGTLSGLMLIQFVRDLRSALPDVPPEWGAVRWVLALGVLVLLLGPLAGPALFVVVYLHLRGGERWFVAATGGTITALVFWVVITRALGAPAAFGALGALAALLLGSPG